MNVTNNSVAKNDSGAVTVDGAMPTNEENATDGNVTFPGVNKTATSKDASRQKLGREHRTVLCESVLYEA